MTEQYVAYYRVSTASQGMQGYGIGAQEEAVAGYLRGTGLNGAARELIGTFSEVETGKRQRHGKIRPQLQAAMEMVKATGAKLLIAKLDRLSRDAAFLLALRESGIEFVACDFPDMNRLVLTVLAGVAEHEAAMISARTKAALAVAKQRGVKLGNPRPETSVTARLRALHKRKMIQVASVIPAIMEIKSTGEHRQFKIAEYLNKRGEKTDRGNRWHGSTVGRMMRRAGMLEEPPAGKKYEHTSTVLARCAPIYEDDPRAIDWSIYSNQPEEFD